jgi:hypothetical protein
MNPNLFRFAAPWTSRALSIAGSAALLFTLVPATEAFAQAAAVIAPQPGQLVSQPLPPAGNDMPEEQPTIQHAWIPGHWHWTQGAYAWVAGHWELPPLANATWVTPQWEQQGSGYILREGFWQQSTATGAAAVTEVSTTQPPPPPRAEMIPERPAPDDQWLPGYWDWRDNQFRWVEGRWEAPPRANVSWVPAHWESRGDRFVLVAGFWRDTAPVVVQAPPPPTQVVVAQPTPAPQVLVVTAPPAPRAEIVYSRPSPHHVWVSGYWAWRGDRYVWIAGHWERPPHGHRDWEAPRWERRGGNYIFIEGHWR